MAKKNELIANQDVRGRPAKGKNMFDGKFWVLIIVMVATIAVGGIFLS